MYYFVGNRYEGCGHKHPSLDLAQKCLRKLGAIGDCGTHMGVYRGYERKAEHVQNFDRK